MEPDTKTGTKSKSRGGRVGDLKMVSSQIPKEKYQGHRGRLTYQKRASPGAEKADLVPGRERARSWIERHQPSYQPTPSLTSDDNVEMMVKLYSDYNIYSVLRHPEWN